MNFQRFNQLLRMGVSPQEADTYSSLYKGGAKKQETTSTQTNTPTQADQYGNLVEGADAWLGAGGLDKNYGGVEGFDPVADMTPEQQAALGKTYQTGNALGELYGGAGTDSLKDYLGAYDPNKTGVNKAIDAANARSNYNFETTQTGAIRQGATDTGQYGGTRQGIAEGLARGQLLQTQQDNANQMTYQDQQQYNQNRLGVLNNLSGITKGLNSGNALTYDAGGLQQGQNQAEIAGGLEKWAYENNVSLNDLIAYKNLISGDMGGTTTGKSTQKGGGDGGSGAMTTIGTIGGAIVGAYFGSPQAGAAAGGAAGGAME